MKITTYDYIDSNKRKTVLLVCLFPLTLFFLLFVVLYFVIWLFPELRVNNSPIITQIFNFYWIFFLCCFLASTLWTVVSFQQSSDIILRSINVAKADDLEFSNDEIEKMLKGEIVSVKEVQRILENVSITAGIPTPKLYILEKEKWLNAFAVGTKEKNFAIVLTKGLIKELDKSEIEAVIAHEVAHIVHKDTRLMMVIVLLIGFFTYFGYILIRSQFRRRSSKGKGMFLILLVGLAFLIYGYVVAPLIRFAVSRTREFEADAKSALLTRNPQALISALIKINEHSIVGIKNSDFGNNELVAPMCIANPLKKKISLFDSLSNLSSTHPPIEKRIQALEVMDGQRLDF